MNLQNLKLESLGINKEKFGKIYNFVDFGNVNYWYEKDERNANEDVFPDGKKLVVDIEETLFL
jgi:hypothetical protein